MLALSAALPFGLPGARAVAASDLSSAVGLPSTLVSAMTAPSLITSRIVTLRESGRLLLDLASEGNAQVAPARSRCIVPQGIASSPRQWWPEQPRRKGAASA